jgi:hypothetical protein
MRPWWDSAWLWSGIGIVTAAVVGAVVVILIIIAMTRRPKT